MSALAVDCDFEGAADVPQAGIGQTAESFDEAYVFLAKNDIELDPQDDEAYDLVVAVAAGAIDDVGEIAAVLASRP